MSVIDRVEGVPARLRQSQPETLATRAVRDRVRYQLLAVGSDLGCALAVLGGLSYYIGGHVMLFVVGALLYVGNVAVVGGYVVRRAGRGLFEYRAILRAAMVLLALAAVSVFAGFASLPALPTGLAVASTALTSALLRTAQRRTLMAARNDGRMRTRTLLVTSPDGAERTIRQLGDALPDAELVGLCGAGVDPAPETAGGVEILRSPEAAIDRVRQGDVEVVVVSAGALAQDELRRFRWAVAETPAELMFLPDLDEVLGGRLQLSVLDATPLLEVRVRPSTAQRLAKDVMDRVLGAVLLVAASPVILGGMLAVRLTSRGPAIFRQVRIGRDSQPFTMLKLRTMAVDAESRRDELLEQNAGAGPLFKMASDPRVTPVGRFLRRFSIDELPQLWNVVRGDMSLVGPRPPLPSEVAAYDSMTTHRLHVRPGLTGLWQVSGRSDLSWEQSVRLDLRYVDNWSIGFDLQILWRTAAAVLGARGAY